MRGLPAGWARSSLRELVGRGGLLSDGDWIESKDQDPSGGVKLVQLSDIGDGQYLGRSSRFMTPERAQELRCKFLQENDVLIARMADPLGRACLFPGGSRPAVTVVDACIVRPPKGALDPRWLTHAINASPFRDAIAQSASGTTRSRISKSNLIAIELPVPPAAEQRRIVAKLGELFARGARAKQALDEAQALLDKLRRAIFAAAFRGDLTADVRARRAGAESVESAVPAVPAVPVVPVVPVEPAEELLARIQRERRLLWEEAELARMRSKGKAPGDDRWKEKYEEPAAVDPRGLPELPSGWCWATVDAITRSKNHLRAPVKSRDRAARPGPFPYYGAFGIIDHVDDFLFDGRFVLVAEDGKNLLDRRRPISVVAEGKFWVNNHAHVLEPADGVPHEYLSSYFNAADLSDRLKGIDQVKLTSSALSALPVPVASAEEMPLLASRLGACLRSLEAVARLHRGLLARAGLLERSLLAKAFRGELVPQEPGDEPAEVMLAKLRAPSRPPPSPPPPSPPPPSPPPPSPALHSAPRSLKKAAR